MVSTDNQKDGEGCEHESLQDLWHYARNHPKSHFSTGVDAGHGVNYGGRGYEGEDERVDGVCNLEKPIGGGWEREKIKYVGVVGSGDLSFSQILFILINDFGEERVG